MYRKSEGTDGPWHVERHPTQYPDLFTYHVLAQNPDAGKRGVVYSGQHLMVASGLDSQPDAKLIAAAPAMLEMLEACLHREDIADDELGEAIRAVIKQATA